MRAQDHLKEMQEHHQEVGQMKHRMARRQSAVVHAAEDREESARQLLAQIEARTQERAAVKQTEQVKIKQDGEGMKYRMARRQSAVMHAAEDREESARELLDKINARTQERAAIKQTELEKVRQDVEGMKYRMARRQSAVMHAAEDREESARELMEKINARTKEREAQKAAEQEKIKKANAEMKYRMERRASAAHHEAEERDAHAAELLRLQQEHGGRDRAQRRSRDRTPRPSVEVPAEHTHERSSHTTSTPSPRSSAPPTAQPAASVSASVRSPRASAPAASVHSPCASMPPVAVASPRANAQAAEASVFGAGSGAWPSHQQYAHAQWHHYYSGAWQHPQWASQMQSMWPPPQPQWSQQYQQHPIAYAPPPANFPPMQGPMLSFAEFVNHLESQKHAQGGAGGFDGVTRLPSCVPIY
jgi:hypothetical protein